MNERYKPQMTQLGDSPWPSGTKPVATAMDNRDDATFMASAGIVDGVVTIIPESLMKLVTQPQLERVVTWYTDKFKPIILTIAPPHWELTTHLEDGLEDWSRPADLAVTALRLWQETQEEPGMN